LFCSFEDLRGFWIYRILGFSRQHRREKHQNTHKKTPKHNNTHDFAVVGLLSLPQAYWIKQIIGTL
jgi:hypothetical protein